MNPKTTKKYLSILFSSSLMMGIFSSTLFYFPLQAEAVTLTKNKTLSLPSNMTGLAAWWTLDGKDTIWTSSTAATTKDKSGNGNTGTLTNMAQATSPALGKIGQGLRFDNSNDYVITSTITGASTTNSATFSAWVRPLSKQGYDGIFFHRGGSGNIGLLLEGTSASITYCWECTPDEYGATTGLTLTNNKWYFISVVITPTAATVYKIDENGTLSSWTNTKTHTTKNLNAVWEIGRDNIGRYWHGDIDDVRLYTRSLSSTELTALYNTGTASHFNVTPKTVQSGLVGHWTFDGKDTPWTSSSAATTLDKSGNGNTGTLASMTQSTSPAAGKIGQALKFDGSNDRVSLSSEIVGTGADSVCVWAMPFGWGEGGFGRIVDNAQFRLYIQQTPANVRFTSDAATSKDSADGVISLNKWHHICATRNSSGVANIYINAEISGTADQASGTPTAGTTSLFIGDRSANDRVFDGLIDDVRIYNRVLSVAEITQLYNLGR